MTDELTQEMLDAWPNCSTPDCGAKTCLRLLSDKCYPCTNRIPRDSEGTAIHTKNCPCVDCVAGEIVDLRRGGN